MVNINGVNYDLLDPADSSIKPKLDYRASILMVGSITIGRGIERGFYYASMQNQFWSLLDGCLNLNGDDSFVNLKNQLNQNLKINKDNKSEFENVKANIVKEFYNKLENYEIAICDIFKSCYIKSGDTQDSSIYVKSKKNILCEYYPKTYYNEILDYCDKYPNCVLVANSMFVYNYLIDNLGEKLGDRIIKIDSPSANYRQKTKEQKLNNWINNLSSYSKYIKN